MLYGYILKMVLADRAAIFVDTVFRVDNYGSYQGITMHLNCYGQEKLTRYMAEMGYFDY